MDVQLVKHLRIPNADRPPILQLSFLCAWSLPVFVLHALLRLADVV